MAGAVVPIIEIAHGEGMWWSLSAGLSRQLLDTHLAGAVLVSFVWDWHEKRAGSYRLEGKKTTISRYLLDFNTFKQTNTDNHRARSFRIIWVPEEHVEAVWTGQIVSGESMHDLSEEALQPSLCDAGCDAI